MTPTVIQTASVMRILQQEHSHLPRSCAAGAKYSVRLATWLTTRACATSAHTSLMPPYPISPVSTKTGWIVLTQHCSNSTSPPLLGDKTTLRDPGRSNAKIWRPPSHISVACQKVAGSPQPYNRAGWPNHDCRFAAWITLVNKGVLHLAFLVDAHCSVGDVKQCSRYAKAADSGHSRVYGVPTTTRALRSILHDNDARPEAHRIRSGGTLAIPYFLGRDSKHHAPLLGANARHRACLCHVRCCIWRFER